MLGLRLWGLEGAGEDQNLGVVDLLDHLGMREVLVENNTLDELGVGEGATSLGDDLDKVEVDVLTLNVGNVEDRLDGEIREVILALGDNLGAEGGHGALSEILVVILLDVDLLLDAVKLVDGDVASLLETIGNLERVNALVEQLLGLLEDGASEDDNTGGTVTDLVILGGGKLNKKLGGLMMDLNEIVNNKVILRTYLHLLKNSGAIVGDDDFTVGRNKHLVHARRAERRTHNVGDSFGRQNISFVSIQAAQTLLLTLVAQDDEGAARLIERYLCIVHVYVLHARRHSSWSLHDCKTKHHMINKLRDRFMGNVKSRVHTRSSA